MIDIFSFAFGFVFGGLFFWTLYMNVKAWKKVAPETGAEVSAGGDDQRLLAANLARQKKKEEMKEKIILLLQSQSRATREDVENSLGVSMATAVRYLDELEAEGKVTQLGESRDTYYQML